MRLPSLFSLTAFFSFALMGPAQADLPPPGAASEVPPAIVKASNDFGFDLFFKLQQQHIAAAEPTNEALSPVSAFLALALAYNGAGPTMRKAMAQTLKTQGLSLEALNAGARSLNARLANNDSDFTLSLANSIWIRSGFAVNPDYAQKMRADYGAQVSTLDFSAPTAAAQINKWASDQTKGRISSIVGDRLSPESVLLLLNATYFKAEWSRPFWLAHTREGAFHTINPQTKRRQSVRATLMSRVDRVRFARLEDWEAVELPYGAEGEASMIIALPPLVPTRQIDVTVLPKLIDRVLAADTTAGVLRLPKFKFFASNALKNTLSQMGMQQAFSPAADFSGLTTSSQVALSEVMQKVHVAVDERGTEAAASTSIDILPTASPLHPLFYMNVNHPFYFAIRDNRDGALLFIGYVEQPAL